MEDVQTVSSEISQFSVPLFWHFFFSKSSVSHFSFISPVERVPFSQQLSSPGLTLISDSPRGTQHSPWAALGPLSSPEVGYRVRPIFNYRHWEYKVLILKRQTKPQSKSPLIQIETQGKVCHRTWWYQYKSSWIHRVITRLQSGNTWPLCLVLFLLSNYVASSKLLNLSGTKWSHLTGENVSLYLFIHSSRKQLSNI